MVYVNDVVDFSKSSTTRPENFINLLIFKKSGTLFMNAAGLYTDPHQSIGLLTCPEGIWSTAKSGYGIAQRWQAGYEAGKGPKPSDLLRDGPWLKLMAVTD